MPTPAQWFNRQPRSPSERHLIGTVTVAGPPCTVQLDPGTSTTTAYPLSGAAYTVNQRVLVLITSYGNYIIGRLQ